MKESSDSGAQAGAHSRPLPPRLPMRAVRELAYVEVASSELTRDINRDVILERIRTLQPISRVDLARASGLQPSIGDGELALLRGAAAVVLQRHSGYYRAAHSKAKRDAGKSGAESRTRA